VIYEYEVSPVQPSAPAATPTPAAAVAPASVETTLTIHVPADAKVRLAGSDTTSLGATRVFTTGHLAAGKTWEGYRVLVTTNRDGQELTKEKVVTLRGGEALELRFDFSETLVASND
jgi:uncharacterized protein (TIGR03000 family)